MESSYNIIYNAPYSPQLNPIEYSFSKSKNKVRQMESKNEKELMNSIIYSLNFLTKEDFIGFFYKSLKNLKKCLKKEKLY